MQITIEKKWPLDAGRKSGGFKGTDGTNYYCEIPVYHMLEQGMTIDAPAERYVSKAGKTSYILDKKWSPPQAANQQSNGHGQQDNAGYNTGVSAGFRAANAAVLNRDVSITQQTLLKAFIGTGQFGLTDLPMLEEACTASARRLVKAAS